LGFSRRGEAENATKNIENKYLTLSFFWPLTYLLPTHHGGPRFVLAGPLASRQRRERGSGARSELELCVVCS
jgi:hypothetical protein